MLSKEEYKRALENMHSQVDIETQWYSYDILKKLIDEHFEPKENTSEFKHFKLHSDSTLKNLTKVGMWVYDSIYKSVYLIKEISKNKKIRVCTFGWIGKFEENRFFPVQYANLTKMEVKK